MKRKLRLSLIFVAVQLLGFLCGDIRNGPIETVLGFVLLLPASVIPLALGNRIHNYIMVSTISEVAAVLCFLLINALSWIAISRCWAKGGEKGTV